MSPKFKLKFQSSKIPYWSSRYEYNPGESEIIENLAPKIQKKKFLTKNEFITIGKWKSPRILKHLKNNEEALIKEITSIALTTKYEKLSIEILQILNGVSYPVASVILHFGKLNQYPIIDFRALWSLGEKVPSTYNFNFWISYVNYCRTLSQKTELDMRTIDMALWQYSKEKQK